MERSKQEKEVMRVWWTENSTTYLSERKIDKVYEAYKAYCEECGEVAINKYIFRTYIRKHGYCNSSKPNPPTES